MRDYSYQDMLKMQEDAANRVREMKKRAAIVVEDEVIPQKPSLPDEVKHISYPVELPAKQQDTQYEEKEHHNGLIKLLKNDKDALMVLALLMILYDREERDQIMSLALLYLLL